MNKQETFRPSILCAIIALVFTALLSGCGEPTIDGTSDESFKASIEVIGNGMTQEERKDFGTAYAVIAMKMTFEGKGVSEIRKSLHGKTAKEVFAMAEKIKADRSK